MSKKFILPGSIVRLKSGGPRMTVVEAKDDRVTCHWFDSKVLHTGVFSHSSLVPDKPSE